MISCVSYKTKPHITAKPTYKFNWNKKCEPTKTFNKAIQNMVDNRDSNVPAKQQLTFFIDLQLASARKVIYLPPRYKNFLSGAYKAAKVKQPKTTHVPKNAVTIILGSMLMAMSNKGPVLRPENEILNTIFFTFFKEKGVKINHRSIRQSPTNMKNAFFRSFHYQA